MDNYWLGKNVFVTGISGFIGGNLAKALVKVGANVFGLIRNEDPKTMIHYEGLQNEITLIKGDLTDKDLLTRIMSEELITNVFHLIIISLQCVGLNIAKIMKRQATMRKSFLVSE